MSSRQPWFGLLHLRPKDTATAPLDGASGAYANVLAFASTSDDYRTAVMPVMESLGLLVVDVERSAPFCPEDATQELNELCDALSDLNPVQYRTFDTYVNDDA